MKKVIDFSINNKFAIWILTIMVIIMGLFSGLNMKQEMMPNINLPNLSVITTYPGAAPDDVAEEVSVPIEQRLQNLEGVELVSSSSLANASAVQIEYDFDTDMDKAENEVEKALADISLPEEATDPEVSRLSLDTFPVLSVSISDTNHSLEELTMTVEDEIVPALEGIDGLSEAQISGQQLEEVTLEFDEDKLLEYDLTEDTITQLIEASDLSFPLGLTNFNGDVKNLVLDGNIATIDDLKALEIPAMPQMGDAELPSGQEGMPGEEAEQSEQMVPDATPDLGDDQQEIPGDQAPAEVPTVELGELAKIEVGHNAESISRTNGEEAIGIQIIKTPDANTVDVVNDVKESLADFEEEFGFTAVTTLDQAEPIEESVSTMLEKALYGILFAVIIILLFLRSFKTTIISIVSIPLSLLVAIFLLNEMDISLNVLTLGALTIAIGRVIDDSIVVMENIYRRMSLPGEELKGKELIREATRQMFVPIFSSTIVTIAVFLPLVLVGGMVGELFLPFALAVSFALAASLLVAVTIVPMLAHSLFKKQLTNKSEEKSIKPDKPNKLVNIYKTTLTWTLNHKWITFGSASLLLVLSFFLVPFIGVSFLPEDEEKMVIATYSPEAGQTIEESEDVALDAEDLISKRDGVSIYQYSIGGGNPMSAMTGMNGDNSALFFIEYEDDFEEFGKESTEVIDELNDMTENGEWNGMDMDSMGGSAFELYVYGDNANDIQTAVDQILPLIEENEDVENGESSLSEPYDQYTLVANQDALSKYGLTAAQVGMSLNNASDKPVLTTVEEDGEQLDVYIDAEDVEYDSIDDLTKIEIDSPLGMKVKVSDVIDVKEGKSPEEIDRRKDKMYASISADILGNDVAGVSSDIEKEINDLELPKHISFEFGGVTEQINESFTQLGLSMLAAIAIIYFILVVTFGGALAPFAILFSLPFTIIGSLVALWIAQEPLSVSAMIGALMLIGIVVTNAIVLVDRVIRNEKDGLPTRDALLEAGSIRLRPILMTALATIGALIPLAIGAEGGGLISKGLGVTVIGGLISSTLLTLVIVPIVYEVLAKFRKKDLNKLD